MKFGLEIEKFLFDLKHNYPSDGVFGFINAVTELENYRETDPISHITNEFVLNMVEITTEPSSVPGNVIKSYLQNYLLLKSVVLRESVMMVPLGSLPLVYQPHVIPKWSYFVQNSILDNKIQSSWEMNSDSPLSPAGNCAGMHVHAEVETPLEYLFSNRELQDKFNIGIMMTPMIAFASSPYFFGQHEAISMRGLRYYYGVYNNFPAQGGIPPVMNSSGEVLLYFKKSSQEWISRGLKIGLPEEDLKKIIKRKEANWNPVRWNRHWNTIEVRCFDSDLTSLDAAKFIWASAAFKRFDLKGEALQTKILSDTELNHKLIEACFVVRDGTVTILPTNAIRSLFKRAIILGLHDEIVQHYLVRLSDFIKPAIARTDFEFYKLLKIILDNKQTTSELILQQAGRANTVSGEDAVRLINVAIENEQNILGHFHQWLH